MTPVPGHKQGERAQAQDSVTDQMQRVLALAIHHGEYDAADWLHKNYPWTCRWSPIRHREGR